jgi:hypothetical protein
MFIDACLKSSFESDALQDGVLQPNGTHMLPWSDRDGKKILLDSADVKRQVFR